MALPECYGIVEGADGLDAGHRSLGSKAGFYKGAWVEHAQKSVDCDLGKELLENKNKNGFPSADHRSDAAPK